MSAKFGALIRLTRLVKDPDSESGYLWTSVVGKHRPITAGSFCTATIIERKPPIAVFYKSPILSLVNLIDMVYNKQGNAVPCRGVANFFKE